MFYKKRTGGFPVSSTGGQLGSVLCQILEKLETLSSSRAVSCRIKNLKKIRVHMCHRESRFLGCTDSNSKIRKITDTLTRYILPANTRTARHKNTDYSVAVPPISRSRTSFESWRNSASFLFGVFHPKKIQFKKYLRKTGTSVGKLIGF